MLFKMLTVIRQYLAEVVQTHSVHRLFNKRGEGKTGDLAKTFWIVNRRGVQKRGRGKLKANVGSELLEAISQE